MIGGSWERHRQIYRDSASDCAGFRAGKFFFLFFLFFSCLFISKGGKKKCVSFSSDLVSFIYLPNKDEKTSKERQKGWKSGLTQEK